MEQVNEALQDVSPSDLKVPYIYVNTYAYNVTIIIEHLFIVRDVNLW